MFCFTAEGNEDEGCTVSLRGLDAPIYYRQRGVLNCGHAVVRQLVVDALVHWRRVYRIDGFVFVNAETLALGECPRSCLCCGCGELMVAALLRDRRRITGTRLATESAAQL